MHDTLICHDMYLRHTGGDGNSFVECHRVWNGDLLLRTLQEAAKKAAAKAFEDNQLCLHKVELIDESTYRKERAK